jgi:general L-amino acid transport system substrate-binding protein
VSSTSLAEAIKSEKPDVRRLVGSDGKLGEQIGLTNDWAARIIALVGNYGEVFERNMGVGSKLGIPRGLNSLWTNGGIQYAPPLR